MEGTTKPGTIQIRVIADANQTEDFSRKLSGFLRSNGLDVIECSPDFDDRFDTGRKKFHVVAIPRNRKRMFVIGQDDMNDPGHRVDSKG